MNRRGFFGTALASVVAFLGYKAGGSGYRVGRGFTIKAGDTMADVKGYWVVTSVEQARKQFQIAALKSPDEAEAIRKLREGRA